MDTLLAFASLALKSSAVLIVAAVIAWAFARGSAALRHRVWTLAVAGLLALPMLQAFAPKLSVVDLTEARFAASEPSATSASPAATRDAAKTATIRDREAPTAMARGAATLIGGLPASGTPSGAPAPPSAWSPARLASVLTWIWALGAALVLGFFAAGRVALERVARASLPLEDPSWRALASEVAASLGIRRPFRLLVSTQAKAPMTWGTFRPVVLLPDAAAQWSPAQRRAILVHELAHLARLDCAIQQAAQIACALYWFHPGAWFAAHRLRVEREPACDDRVLADGASASAYATQLLDAVRAARGGGLFAVSSAAMAESRLHERVRALLDPGVDRRPVARGPALAAGALAIALVSFVAVLAPKSARDAEAGDTPHATQAAPVAATPVEPAAEPAAPAAAEPLKADAASGLAGRWDRTVEEARVAYEGRAFWIVYAVPPGATRHADESLLSDSEGWHPEDLTRRGKSLAERYHFADDDAVFLFRVPASGKAKGPGFDRVAIRGAELVPDLGGLPVASLGRTDVDESLSWIDRRLAATPDDERARVLVSMIALHDTPRALVSLQSVLNGERDAHTRAESAEGLVRHPSQRSLDVLVEHARSDASTKVSAECAESIGDLDLPQATEELIDLALDLDDETVRQEAVEALGGKDPGRVIATLLVVADEDPSETVRREAVETLGDLSGDEGVMALRHIVSRTKDAQVRSEAMETLEEVAQKRHSRAH